MKRIHDLLLDTSCSITRYIIRAYLIQFIPVIAIWLLAGIVFSVVYAFGVNSISIELIKIKPTVIGSLVFSPLCENGVMILGLELCRRVNSLRHKALLIAIPMGVAHLGNGPLGLTTIWSFYVFSISYLAYRNQGRLKASFVSVCLHSLANLIPAFFIDDLM